MSALYEQQMAALYGQQYAQAPGVPGPAQAFRENAIGRRGGLLPDDPDENGNFPDPFAIVFNPFRTNPTAIPPQETRPVSVTLSHDGAFVVGMYVFTISADGLAAFSITDTATSREQMTDFVADVNIAGTAQNPFYLTVPRTYPQNTTIKLNVQNRAAVGGTDITALEFVMHGYKVLDPRMLGRAMQLCLGMRRR